MTSGPGAAGSFGRAADQPVIESDLSGVRHKLARAMKEARSLEMAVSQWKASTTFGVGLEPSAESRSTLDHVIEMSRSFPHDQWSTLFGEIGYLARSSLDNVHTLLASRVSAGAKLPARTAFPITTSEELWTAWAERHLMLPGWVLNRYYVTQPFRNQYHGLRGLHWANNKDKHVWLRDVRVAVVGDVDFGGFAVEGRVDEGDLRLALRPGSNVFSRGTRRIVASSFDVGHPVLESTSPGKAEVEVELLFDVGYAEYKLPEVAELVRRVGDVVDYVALGDVRALHRYFRAPSFVTQSAPGDQGGSSRSLSEGAPLPE
ncbi:MAG: hypothetical protein BGO47_01525 [Microbacterium sp. 67-17]|uniref:hypothetical protein n=1 Tax=Microbacterium sp. 67-17 TaxID=1895782 RepID=UPI000962CB5B|nr:hypothetical protein [Microbacterium sp. 67-17]OJW00520.1 MAG: hypothetical protein BGO47_01525 [Microbacterium sp. 67-17]